MDPKEISGSEQLIAVCRQMAGMVQKVFQAFFSTVFSGNFNIKS
jgi:hypothetical protein